MAAIKEQLRRFTSERQSWAPDAAAGEFGELVLCVIQQADRLGVDLVSAGEAHLLRAVAGSRTTKPAAAPAKLALVASAVAPRARR
jgi:hypothetical protein